MNVVASSLGIGGRPEGIVAELAAAVRAGSPLPTIDRRCLKVGDTYGFVFGNGLMANFLEEYYSGEDGYGPGRALWLLARTFSSALVDGRLRRARSSAASRAGCWSMASRTALAPPDRRGGGHRARGGPGLQAEPPGRRGPRALLGAGHPQRGRCRWPWIWCPCTRAAGCRPNAPTAPSRRGLEIDPDTTGEHVYTIDGDLYRAVGPPGGRAWARPAHTSSGDGR